jgi:hypothetical protein
MPEEAFKKEGETIAAADLVAAIKANKAVNVVKCTIEGDVSLDSVTVEGRLTIPQGFFQNLNTEVPLQGVGQPPGEHIPAVPIHDGHQIQEASSHGDVGNVGAPDLVGLGNRYTP